MIQYPISIVELKRKAQAEKPGWLERAKARTKKYKIIGYYKDSSGIWSEIKAVYMRLQHGKCAYCERQLESEEYGRIEHDVEHFRPKKRARPWKLTPELVQAGVNLTAPVTGKADPGYHLLAYNLLNYCASCKPCNSSIKSDNFPIEGTRTPGGNDPVQLCSEKPFLVNPIGNFDDNPESLIFFHGLSPMTSNGSVHKMHRGLVTIAFFHLDDRSRKYLFRERANVIVSLYSFLELATLATNRGEKVTYQGLVTLATKPSAQHANCARSFRNLYNQNQNEATDLFNAAVKYLESISD